MKVALVDLKARVFRRVMVDAIESIRPATPNSMFAQCCVGTVLRPTQPVRRYLSRVGPRGGLCRCGASDDWRRTLRPVPRWSRARLPGTRRCGCSTPIPRRATSYALK